MSNRIKVVTYIERHNVMNLNGVNIKYLSSKLSNNETLVKYESTE